jgi:tetratricopeptide (TPR) repeat protein
MGGMIAVFAAAAAPAGTPTLPPESDQPYVWKILVHTQSHPSLHSVRRTQFLKNLKASLTSALGSELGTVEVIDLTSVAPEKWEPHWKAWNERGWAALPEDKSLRKITGVKTHFLKVQVKDGRFRIESQQHDGNTGLLSPMVRVQEVSDADTLGRVAGLMLGMDFGPVGTVELLPENSTHCLIRLRGGDLNGIDRWVKLGDVFTFSIVRNMPRPPSPEMKPPATKPGQKFEIPTEPIAQQQSITLLKVVDLPKPGIAKCEIHCGYLQPFPNDTRVIGYRALKLATHAGPVSVRVVNDQAEPPPASTPLEVWANDTGFRDKPSVSDTLDGRNQVYTSGRNLCGLGCVVVKLGSERKHFVVPILEGGPPVPLQFEYSEAKVKAANFENKCERFYERVVDAYQAQDELLRALRGMIQKQQNQAALERASTGVKVAQSTDTVLTQELTQLQQHPLASNERAKRLLESCERNLEIYRQGKPSLEAKIEELKVVIAKANNPAEFEREFKMNELKRQITYHERRGEIPEALDVYDQLYELTKSEEVKERKQKLEEEWRVKSPEHDTARKYVTDEWSKLNTTAEIKGGIPKLRAAVEQMAKSQDKYGLRWVQTGILSAVTRLKDVGDTLSPDLVQDKEQIKELQAVLDELRKVDELARDERKKLGDN